MRIKPCRWSLGRALLSVDALGLECLRNIAPAVGRHDLATRHQFNDLATGRPVATYQRLLIDHALFDLLKFLVRKLPDIVEAHVARDVTDRRYIVPHRDTARIFLIKESVEAAVIDNIGVISHRLDVPESGHTILRAPVGKETLLERGRDTRKVWNLI